ncbi:callose synthase 12-like protein [Tanacetum coccineum]
MVLKSTRDVLWTMSAQETSFVTLGQRVLANPLKIRLHYGHPDVFDRFWFLTRGGISKASRLINLSEDIFAGFNCTLRGGNITHHEYIQVGKGRDVGLNQVSMFEAKVASGNGQQYELNLESRRYTLEETPNLEGVDINHTKTIKPGLKEDHNMKGRKQPEKMINMDYNDRIKATKVEITEGKGDDLPGYRTFKHYKKSYKKIDGGFNQKMVSRALFKIYTAAFCD